MKNLITLFIFAFAILSSSDAEAQKFPGLDKSPADIATYPRQNPIVKVIYGRPQLNGRDLETLAPQGKLWRTGANEATEIIFFKDVVFGGKELKSGVYTLFSIPGEEEWTLILNSDINVWGSYSYNEAHDVLRVPAKVSDIEEPVEAFAIAFTAVESGAMMHMAWGNKVVSVSIQ